MLKTTLALGLTAVLATASVPFLTALAVDIRVRFADGLLTEFYPRAAAARDS